MSSKVSIQLPLKVVKQFYYIDYNSKSQYQFMINHNNFQYFCPSKGVVFPKYLMWMILMDTFLNSTLMIGRSKNEWLVKSCFLLNFKHKLIILVELTFIFGFLTLYLFKKCFEKMFLQ